MQEQASAGGGNEAIVRRFFEEMCNGRRLDLADELFAADHTYHDPSAFVGRGPEGMKLLLLPYHVAFPDVHWTVDEMIVSGDTVETHWTGHGTHRGDLLGISPTGKPVTVPGRWIHRIVGGKIVESWNVWDKLGLLRQLGSGPGIAGARARCLEPGRPPAEAGAARLRWRR